MAVNEKNAWRFICTALERNEERAAGFIESIRAAWKELRDHRQKPGSTTNLDLTAAEHYLFARWCVASGNVSKDQMIDLSQRYYRKKRWDAFMDAMNEDAVTAGPAPEPDLGVVIFGVMGALQGAADHAGHKVTRTPPRWRPMEELVGGDGFFRPLGAG